MKQTTYTINVNGTLMDLSIPRVMGIVNVTPDSFFAGSRTQTENGWGMERPRTEISASTGGDIGGHGRRYPRIRAEISPP